MQIKSNDDFIFPLWKKDEHKKYRKTIHELRCQGYRKVDQQFSILNCYEYYRRRGKKKTILIITMYP